MDVILDRTALHEIVQRANNIHRQMMLLPEKDITLTNQVMHNLKFREQFKLVVDYRGSISLSVGELMSINSDMNEATHLIRVEQRKFENA